MKASTAALIGFVFCAFTSLAAEFGFSERVVRGEGRSPASITTNAAGHVVVDFGQHAFGWLEADVTAKGEYCFIWGELLDESGSVQTNAFYTKEQGRIRCACTKSSFEGSGWSRVPYRTGNNSAFNESQTGRFGLVMPFRWLEVVSSPFPITAANVRQVPIHYPYDMTEESFDCDSPALIRVHDFCKHTIRATTYTGKFIDGDRERLPYEADSFITQLSTYAMTSDHTLVRAMADYLATHTTWPTEWKQFFISIIYADWRYSGRTDLIEKHYARMSRDKLWHHLRRADGLLVTQGPSVTPAPDGEKPEDIVDWAKCYRDGFVMRPVNTVVNALHIRNLREMAQMAAAIGKVEDAARFAADATQTFAAFQERLWDAATGRYRDGEGTSHATVQGNAMALACGAVPPERRQRVADYVVSKGFSCSTYMAQFVLDALFAAGRAREAIALMTSEAHRGWLAMMAQGATVTPEFWDLTLSEEGRIPDMNHAWSTSPLNVISRFVLGVTPAAPGFAKVSVRPQPGDLARVSGAVPTPRGAVKVALERIADDWQVTLDLPMPASFEFFGFRRELSAGRHSFAIPAAVDAALAQGVLEPLQGDLLILPFGEGMAYPVDTDIPLEAPRLRFANGMELSMGFYGRCRNGVFTMIGVRNALDASLVFSRTNSLLRVAYSGPADNLRVFTGATIGEAAAAYRAWRESLGSVRTMAEKLRTNPNLADFAGTADIWLWDDNTQNRLYNWPLKANAPKRDTPRIADEMRSLGLDRVLWNSFEGETPQDCAYLKRLGYHVGTYECLRDVFHKGLLDAANPKDYERAARFLPIAEEITRVAADGSFGLAWQIPDKKGGLHSMYSLCDAMGLEMCRRFIAPEVRRIGYDSRLMDVQAGGGPADCHSKAHPCTRSEALEALRREHRYMCDDLRQITGVEVGTEMLADAYHYSEGLTSCPHPFRKALCWRYKDRALYGDEVPPQTRDILHNPRYRIPLWELVYHDCTVSYYYWADSTLMYPELVRVKDLFCALYGLPPIYSMNVSTWEGMKHAVAASYRRAVPVARRTMFSRMTEFETLTPDRLVQRTRFANGVTVTANFSKSLKKLPEGKELAPGSYLIGD